MTSRTLFVASRNLLRNRTRLGLSVAGVALAVTLVVLLSGLRGGMYRQVGIYQEHMPGSIVVAQQGVGNLLATTSLLPAGTDAAVQRIDGVARVTPVLAQFAILDLHGRKQPVYLIGYETERGGGPWLLSEGRVPAADDEAVFDRVLASRHGMHVGDRFSLLGRTFTLVGLSRGTSSFVVDYLFVRKGALEGLLSVSPGTASFLFVEPARGSSDVALLGRLRDVPGTNSLSKRQMIANDEALMGKLFNAPILLMVTIAFFVGTLVVGLVIYTAAVERRREYGVLKAIGAENRTLYLLVATQALVTTLVGAALGVLLAAGAGQLIMALRPQFLVVVEATTVAASLGSGLLIAVLASIAPAWLIARLAPADVFRG